MLTDKERKLFEGKNFPHLATINPDGTPQVSPLWVTVEGDLIIVNTARGRKKERNMARNPQVALSVYDQDNPYDSASIQGEVVEMTEDGADDVIDALAKKYMDKDKYPFRQAGEQRVTVKIKKKS